MSDNRIHTDFNSDKDRLFEKLLQKKGLRAQKTPVIPRQEGLTEGPLSFAQERLWFLQQFDPESPAYNIPLAIRLQGTIRVPVLERRLNQIVRRHESLRTTFRAVGGRPVQIVAPPEDFTLPVITPPVGEIQELPLREAARRPFDMEHGPLFRVALFQLGETEAVLLMTIHHLVADGWSVGIILKELIALFEAECDGKPSPLPDLPVSYLDFAIWQRDRIQGEFLERELSYWRQQLAGAPPVLDLPLDHPRPKVQSSQGTFAEFTVPAPVLKSLKALAGQQNATLFMLLLALFKTQLYRYTAQEDLLVGTPVAGRNQVETEGLIGLFVNTLVLRTDFSGAPSFIELLERVRRVALDAYAHQELPFEKLVEELRPERNLSYTPLFQVMFVFQNAPLPAVDLPGIKVTPLTIDCGFAQFDLSMTLWEEDEGLKGTLEYNTDLFEAATIERMIGHYRMLLEAAVADPRQKITQAPLLTPAERRQILEEWNGPHKPYPRERGVHQLFEDQAAKTPEAVAVIFEERRLTYRELNQRANQLARFLQKQGVGPGSVVGLYLDYSLELMVGVMGVLKAGAAYLPLDPAYPEKRLALMLADSGAALLLTQQSLAAANFRFQVPALRLDEEWAQIAGEDGADLERQYGAGNTACIIYTSGSTGLPKGVLLGQGNLANLVVSFIRSYQPGPSDRILPLTALGSASFVGEILPLLCAGGALVLIDKANFLDFDRLVELIAAYEITIISSVPAVMAKLNAGGFNIKKLRLILSGGEALYRHDIDRLLKTTTVVNGYGLTETSICSTFAKLDAETPDTSGVISIGKPVMNHQVYILDPHLNLLPAGCPGEIYIGGDGLAAGYLNNPELTQARFINNPFRPGERIYRTGDRAVWTPDGAIQYLGRADRQVKLRGFRIEPAEIATQLGQHPDVQDAVVAIREDLAGEKRLVAYVVLKPGPMVESSELRDFLKQKLPDYMVPAAIEILAGLPLNANGKVDLDTLPAPSELGRTKRDYQEPRTETERVIVDIWKEILGIEVIGIHDNFFDLGGHSLLLTQVHSKLKAVFTAKPLAIVDLFKYPDVASLAGYLEAQEGPAPGGATIQAPPALELARDRADKRREALQQQNQLWRNRMPR
ncbi:MAG: amino acid adenylation domain-containing protein [Firmicutes bacterium]|nr:amino acid adenylation domain-containing protein [Bacillota bacterium]